jgi:hypothetical protein
VNRFGYLIMHLGKIKKDWASSKLFVSHLMRLVTKNIMKDQQGLFLDFRSQPPFERKLMGMTLNPKPSSNPHSNL